MSMRDGPWQGEMSQSAVVRTRSEGRHDRLSGGKQEKGQEREEQAKSGVGCVKTRESRAWKEEIIAGLATSFFFCQGGSLRLRYQYTGYTAHI